MQRLNKIHLLFYIFTIWQSYWPFKIIYHSASNRENATQVVQQIWIKRGQ